MMRNDDDPSFDDCLRRFHERSSQCIRNAYDLEHPPRRDPQGALRTSLPSDLFGLLRTESTILRDLFVQEGLSPTGDEARQAWRTVLRHVQTVHAESNVYLSITTVQDACAAANDCLRMAENMETLAEECWGDIDDAAAELIRVWSMDAVAAAGRTQVFTAREVQAAVGNDYFSTAWEDEWTQNEVSWNVVDVFDDMLKQVEESLVTEYLYHKAVGMAVKALVCFYIRSLVNKADTVLRKRRNRVRFLQGDAAAPFQNHQRALRRMADDIVIFKEFCEGKCEGSPVLRRIAVEELYILDLIHESLEATELESLESFILVLHKRTGADLLVTRYFVGDLWTLMMHHQRKSHVQKTVQGLHPDLVMVTKGMQERAPQTTMDELVHMDLGHMLKAMYEDRVAQGIVPACYPCLPKIPLERGDGRDDDEEVVAEHIRAVTRKMEELKWFAKRMGHHHSR